MKRISRLMVVVAASASAVLVYIGKPVANRFGIAMSVPLGVLALSMSAAMVKNNGTAGE